MLPVVLVAQRLLIGPFLILGTADGDLYDIALMFFSMFQLANPGVGLAPQSDPYWILSADKAPQDMWGE